MKTDYWVRASVYGVDTQQVTSFMPSSKFKHRRTLKVRVDQLTYGYKWSDEPDGYRVDEIKEFLTDFTLEYPGSECLVSFSTDNEWGYSRGFARIKNGELLEDELEQRERGLEDDDCEDVIDEWVFCHHDNHNREVAKHRPRLRQEGRGGLVFTRYKGQRVFIYEKGLEERVVLRAKKIHEKLKPTVLVLDIISTQRVAFKRSENAPVVRIHANRPHSVECRAGDTLHIEWLDSWIQVHVMEVFPKRSYLEGYQSKPHTRMRVEADTSISVDREEIYRKKNAVCTNHVPNHSSRGYV